MRNVAALGATLGHMDFPLDGLLDSIRAQFAHKAPEIAEQNIAVATAGLRARPADAVRLPLQARTRRRSRRLTSSSTATRPSGSERWPRASACTAPTP